MTYEPLTVAELGKRAKALRVELRESAADADARNVDAAVGMRRLWEEGFYRFTLPVAHGGITDADPTRHAEDFFAMLVDVMAGDSSTGMNYAVQSLVTLEVFAADNGLPESTKGELAELIHRDGIRFVASNAETGNRTGPVTGRRVEGGIVVNGTKTFNTNSGGGGWASVGITLEGEEGGWRALTPLDQPGVTCRHDWDVMGQRGTHSQTIEYHDIFVPDGYFFRGRITPALAGYVFLAHAAIMLGPGYGAFDAAVEYVRGLDRASLPEFSSASEDPLVRRRIGEFAVQLDCARAYLLSCARKLENWPESYPSEAEATVEAFSVKVACVKAALEVTSGIFDLTGARSTSSRYRFDRFWRNARTFATHDPTDAKEVWVGDWHLSGQEPPLIARLRV
ncbi:acyl-CoA dehydrogenase family protein [Kutzneria sp. NPDC052558]|uniref:acyl-CoA dehydrogenase family protein n=1 Tax=Kutzneria sp. NPDC052558 TaxID=3364121 RepID=UPI0037CC034C